MKLIEDSFEETFDAFDFTEVKNVTFSGDWKLFLEKYVLFLEKLMMEMDMHLVLDAFFSFDPKIKQDSI